MLYPVILCGGYGTRLWPLSRANLPKQFIPLFGDTSLFQNTLARVEKLGDKVAMTYVVANQKQKYLVNEQMKAVGFKAVKVFLEPQPCSTAPAITLAALYIYRRDPKGVMIALPSDNVIKKTDVFVKFVQEASEAASKYEKLLLFSSKAKYGESGYGYIKGGKSIASEKDNINIQEIEYFKEKPSSIEAEALIKEDYQWNAGIFILPVKLYLDEMKIHAKEILHACKKILAGKLEVRVGKYDFIKFRRKDFDKCPVMSIDYALIENTNKAAVIKTDIGWHDVGSWQSLYEILPKDPAANVVKGEVYTIAAKNSHIYSTARNRLIAAIGLDNITVIQTDDSTLVMPTDLSQDVKKITATLMEKGKRRYLTNPVNYTSWGSYEIIRREVHFKVKKVTVKPKHKMFIKANSKAKHFIITQGKAKFKFGSTQMILKRTEPLLISKNQDYTITNLDSSFLEIVKVESRWY